MLWCRLKLIIWMRVYIGIKLHTEARFYTAWNFEVGIEFPSFDYRNHIRYVGLKGGGVNLLNNNSRRGELILYIYLSTNHQPSVRFKELISSIPDEFLSRHKTNMKNCHIYCQKRDLSYKWGWVLKFRDIFTNFWYYTRRKREEWKLPLSCGKEFVSVNRVRSRFSDIIRPVKS